jgi:hypothetical protein
MRPPCALDRLREGREVLERVELPLFGKCRQGSGIERANGARSSMCHRAQARAVRRFELALERRALVAFGEEQVAVDAREVAVDALLPHDGLDAVDRRGMAVGGEARAFAAVQLLDLEVAVIERVGEVRRWSSASCRPRPARRRARDLLARAGEGVRGRHAGIPAPTTQTSS